MTDKLKAYAVEMPAGSRITTVYAGNVDEARDQAYNALNLPGRYALYMAWRDGGMRVRDKETNQVYMD